MILHEVYLDISIEVYLDIAFEVQFGVVNFVLETNVVDSLDIVEIDFIVDMNQCFGDVEMLLCG